MKIMHVKWFGLLLIECLVLMQIPFASSDCAFSDATNDVYHSNSLEYYYSNATVVSAPYVDIVGVSIDTHTINLQIMNLSVDPSFRLVYMIYITINVTAYQYIYISSYKNQSFGQIISVINNTQRESPSIIFGSEFITISTDIITFYCPHDDNLMIKAYRYLSIDPLNVYVDFYPNHQFERISIPTSNDPLLDIVHINPYLYIVPFIIMGVGLMTYLIWRLRACSIPDNQQKSHCKAKYGLKKLDF